MVSAIVFGILVGLWISIDIMELSEHRNFCGFIPAGIRRGQRDEIYVFAAAIVGVVYFYW